MSVTLAVLALGGGLFTGGPDHELTCESTSYFVGSYLDNGDHINMDITQGGSVFQVNAYVDRNVPSGWKNLGLRFSDGTSKPLSKEEVKSGVITFPYSQLLDPDKDHTVQWVQYNDTYFNQDRDPEQFLECKVEKEVPPQPEDIVTVEVVEERGMPYCDDDDDEQLVDVTYRKVQTTITHTFNEETWAWEASEPVEEVIKEWSKTVETDKDCELPDTGFEHVALGLFAAIFIGGGVFLIRRNRKRD